MSTQKRYTSIVYKALCKLDKEDDSGWGYSTVGEVAKQAGVSRPTTGKYLRLLSEMGYATYFETDSKMRLYRPLKVGEE